MSQPRKPPGRVKLFFRKLLHRDSHADRAHSQQSIVRSPSEPPSPTRGQSADVPASNQENQGTGTVSQDSPTVQASHGADLRPVQASAPATTGTGDVPVSEEERAGNLPLSGNMPPAPHETESSNAAPAHDAPSTPRGNLAGHTAWTVFREALKLTEKVSDVFPPLKAAVSGLNSVLDRIDMVSTARADFADVHDQVNSFAKVIQKYQGLDEDNVPMDIRRRVKGFAQALDLINSSIKDKLDRGTFSSFLSTSYDQTEIVRHVRNIGYLVNEFMMATTANTDTNVEELLKDAKFNKLKYFAEAAFNGPHSFGKGCMEDTRVSVLGDLMSWAVDSGPNASNVYWLTGLAGTGKSAIAYSFCRLLNDAGLLGGSFFCSRQGCLEQSDVQYILPTLAQLLARVSGSYAAALLKSLDRDPDSAKLSLDEQFENLMHEPFAAISKEIHQTHVLVIDALDECEDDDKVLALVQLFIQYARKLKLKIFMTSRPENQMRKEFGHLHINQTLYLHHIKDSLVKSDIYKYLEKKLIQIFKKCYSSDDHMPLPDQIEALAKQADRLFIYAFTVLQYIGWKNADPKERLIILTSESYIELKDTPINPVYKLYHFILLNAYQGLNQNERAHRQHFLACILSQFKPMSIQTISLFLNVKMHQMNAITSGFHSVLDIPVNNPQGHVTTFHASFGDYITNKYLQDDCYWHMEISEAHYYMTCRCFEIMKQYLHFNIADCETSYKSNKRQILDKLSEELVYACTYWPEHLMRCSNQASLMHHLTDWMQHLLLYWLEVISIKKVLKESMLMLKKLYQNCEKSIDKIPKNKMILNDILHFLNVYREPISASVPHIYISALAFGARDFVCLQPYITKFPNLLALHCNFKANIQYPILNFTIHEQEVWSVAISPDGQYAVSGYMDSLIRIWDIKTGEVMRILKTRIGPVISVTFSSDGHYIMSGFFHGTISFWSFKTGKAVRQPIHTCSSSDYMLSAALSPNDQYIVSGHYDGTIKLWNSHTGEAAGEFVKQHSSYIHSVAFSPDGQYIVSSSHDHTIRLWRFDTCKAIRGPMKGHNYGVTSVTFSPDGQYIASGSNDKTIKFWRSNTGEDTGKIIEGHTDSINSIAFSPDGQYIVSGSNDRTIRLWRSDTGKAIGRPIGGHMDDVTSVVFSPDGQHILSGSRDTTIKFWKLNFNDMGDSIVNDRNSIISIAVSSDSQYIVSSSIDNKIRIWRLDTGKAVKSSMEGHTDHVFSVAFSPDNQYIASASRDKTIRLWKADTAEAIGKPIIGHTKDVYSVAFSPNGQYIVSSSADKTIRLWKFDTGESIGEPMKGHSEGVKSVIFSPDGQYIVSCSYDDTIKIWKSETGEAVERSIKLEKRYTINSVALSPDGQYIVSGSDHHHTIRLWKFDTCEEILPVDQSRIYNSYESIKSVAFSPNGQYIVSGSKNNTFQIWRSDTGKAVGRPIYGHTDSVDSIAFSPDGLHIVSGSKDGTIRVWNVDTMKHTNPGSNLDSDENTILHSSTDKEIISDAQDSSSNLQLIKLHNASVENEIWWHTECPPKHRSSWVLGPNNEHLLWIPPYYSQHLHWPHNILTIATHYVVTLDLSKFEHGEVWSRCNGKPLLRLTKKIEEWSSFEEVDE